MMSGASTPIDRDCLVRECQGLVRHLAQQARARMPAWVEMDDLVGYGQVGLMQAARDFDPNKGTKFSTFAYYRIRGAIFDGVNKLMWFRAARDPETRYSQMADDLLQTAASEPASEGPKAEDELTREGGWFSRVASSLAIVYLASSDDAGRTTDVVDESVPAPWAGMVQRETSSTLREVMSKLPADAAALIRAVYYEDRTLEEAASRLGISKSWASRMHARALEQMARSFRQLDPDESPGPRSVEGTKR